MNDDHSIEVKFWVESLDFDSKYISTCLGRDATKDYIKGVLNSGGIPFKKHYWEYNFGGASDVDFPKLKKEVVNFLEAKTTSIKELKKTNCVFGLTILVSKSRYHVGIQFDQRDLKVIADANVPLDISIYSVDLKGGSS